MIVYYEDVSNCGNRKEYSAFVIRSVKASIIT